MICLGVTLIAPFSYVLPLHYTRFWGYLSGFLRVIWQELQRGLNIIQTAIEKRVIAMENVQFVLSKKATKTAMDTLMGAQMDATFWGIEHPLRKNKRQKMAIFGFSPPFKTLK